MKRRVVLINFCMLMGLVLMAFRLTSAWEGFQETHNLDQIAGGNGGTTTAGLSGVEPMGPPPPFSDFIVISDRSLFAESRRPPVVEEEVLSAALEPAAPFLYLANTQDPQAASSAWLSRVQPLAAIYSGTSMATQFGAHLPMIERVQRSPMPVYSVEDGGSMIGIDFRSSSLLLPSAQP